MLYQNKVKWCPAPNCTYAIEVFVKDSEVLCKCGNYFCFKCTKEGHKPVICELVTKWEIQGQESNGNLMELDNYRNCPHCGILIERTEGCNRMHCAGTGACGKFFCWRCLEDHGYDFMDF